MVEGRDAVDSHSVYQRHIPQYATVRWCSLGKREGSTLKILCDPTLTAPLFCGWKHSVNGPDLKTLPSKKTVLKGRFPLSPFAGLFPFQSSFASLVAHTDEVMQHDAQIHTFWKKFSGESISSYSSDASAKYVPLLTCASSLYLSLMLLQPAKFYLLCCKWTSFSCAW